jgi:hypothetical protein
MADLIPSRIESLGDGAELPEDSRRGRTPKPKVPSKPNPATPPVDVEKDDSHQLDELA